MTRFRDADFKELLQKTALRVKLRRNTRDRVETINRLKKLMLREAEKGETHIVLPYWIEDTAMEFFQNSGLKCERSDYPRTLKYCPCGAPPPEGECICSVEEFKLWLRQREEHRRTTIKWDDAI